MRIEVLNMSDKHPGVRLLTKFTPSKFWRFFGHSTKITIVVCQNGEYRNYYTNKKYRFFKEKIDYAYNIALVNKLSDISNILSKLNRETKQLLK